MEVWTKRYEISGWEPQNIKARKSDLWFTLKQKKQMFHDDLGRKQCEHLNAGQMTILSLTTQEQPFSAELDKVILGYRINHSPRHLLNKWDLQQELQEKLIFSHKYLNLASDLAPGSHCSKVSDPGGTWHTTDLWWPELIITRSVKNHIHRRIQT